MNFEELEQLVKMEIAQREEEGCDVAEIKEKLAEIREKSPSKLERLLIDLSKASPTPNFPYKEPSNLPEIKDQRPDGPRRMDLKLSDKELLDKIYGGWLGRCAGCLLGKL